jgi:hypothetical protein
MMIIGATMIRRTAGGRLVGRCQNNNNSQVCNVTIAIRNHMGHHGHPVGGNGSGFGLQRRASIEQEDEEENGGRSRSPLTLGLEASEATQNILRLLESSHLMMMGGSGRMMMMEGVWHERGVRWVPREDDGGGWTHVHAHDEDNGTPSTNTIRSSTSTIPLVPPRIWSLQFADARTALAHLQGPNGAHALLSLVRLNSQYGMADNGALYNGWRIIRSVEASSTNTHHPLVAADNSTAPSSSSSYAEIEALVQTYMNVEHGGGTKDVATARRDLFDPSASLVTIGRSALPTTTTPQNDAWTAPSGSLLEISLDTYLHGVQNQTPHDMTKRSRDEILAIRILPGIPQAAAAAVELRVGNGKGDTVFHDHLLLGKQPVKSNDNDDDSSGNSLSSSSWKILSKIFSVHKW